jgi:hypothetical protein
LRNEIREKCRKRGWRRRAATDTNRGAAVWRHLDNQCTGHWKTYDETLMIFLHVQVWGWSWLNCATVATRWTRWSFIRRTTGSLSLVGGLTCTSQVSAPATTYMNNLATHNKHIDPFSKLVYLISSPIGNRLLCGCTSDLSNEWNFINIQSIVI